MIGERLSEIRKDYGDRQADLATKLNVSLPTVRSWEQEKSSPSHEMLVKICRLYKISSDYLLGLSNVDPAYIRQKYLHSFSQQELQKLQKYGEYLIWERQHPEK